MKDLRREDRIIEKEMVKQCQYLVLVEQKHKEVCEKYGVPSTLNPTRFETLQELMTENHKNKQIKQEKVEKEKQKKLGNVEVTARRRRRRRRDKPF